MGVGVQVLLGLYSLSLLVLNEILLVPALMYVIEAMIRKKKERSTIRAVQREQPESFLGIRRMNKVPYEWIRKLYGVAKGVDEKIDEGVLR